MRRWSERPTYAIGVATLFTAAVFAPTVLGTPDSFPLSTYPMFAKHRGQPEMVKLVAVTDDGNRPVRPGLLGTMEVLQAKALLEQVATKSAAQRRRFCTQTAEQLAPLPETASWHELNLVRVKYDPIGYFYGEPPVSEKVLTHCLLRGETAPEAESTP